MSGHGDPPPLWQYQFGRGEQEWEEQDWKKSSWCLTCKVVPNCPGNDYYSHCMANLPIIAVAGLLGSGKTHWISQQIVAASQSVLYCCPGSGNVPIDAHWIAAHFPQVKVVDEGQEMQHLIDLDPGTIAYVELGFHLDLATEFLAVLPCHKVAVLPPGYEDNELRNWADEVSESKLTPTQNSLDSQQLIRSPLEGEVIDPASLNIFWDELTQGAYGDVQRAKGIFDLVDGRSFHFDFVAQMTESKFTELPLPRWLDGRPQRFSGIEVGGNRLDSAAIAQTLQDCCLAEEMIAYYQEQIKAQPEEIPV